MQYFILRCVPAAVKEAVRLATTGCGCTRNVVQSAVLRLRPVLMTALVEILGLLPFLLSAGVGIRNHATIGDRSGGRLVDRHIADFAALTADV